MAMDLVDVAARAPFRPKFNFEFLVFFIICGVLSIFFLLYFNRLFASIVSYGIRTWTWHRYRVYLDISALQISLLAGRIFFTGLRYHGSNETFLIQHGYITWRYWLRRVREVDVDVPKAGDEHAASGKAKNATLPCRINVDLLGLEWFVYNRSPAYDTILAGLTEGDSSQARSSNTSDEKDGSKLRPRNPRHDELDNDGLPRQKSSTASNGAPLSEKGGSGYFASSPDHRSNTDVGSSDGDERNDEEPSELPSMLKLFPIHVNCQKAAAVIGNDNTKAVLIVKSDSVFGDVDASDTNTYDPYRQVFKVRFKHPVIEMRDNEDFKEDQTSRASRERDNAQDRAPVTKTSFFRHQRRKVVSSLRDLVPYWRRSVESFSSDSRAGPSNIAPHIPGSTRWQGLSRYLDDRDQSDKARWTSVEYAAVTTILDSPEATLNVYWDVVAKVTERARRNRHLNQSANINGSEPPAWGMQLSVKGGTMNYGPWADRQRADLQRMFFPTLAKDAFPANPPSVGDWRVPTQFQFLVEFDDAVTLRVPIREESKNWRWRGKEPQLEQQKYSSRRRRNRGKKATQGEAAQLRPAGWLEVKVPPNSTATYTMDMLASSTGYRNRLDLDFPSTELWSSVNHDLLWRSGPQRVSCDLSNPLPWNTLRDWHFSVTAEELKLYLLRDHVFLLIDLVDDWSSGPPSEYLVFTPYKYHLHLDFRNVQLFFNVNDDNIIDKPTSHDDNAYLILSSPSLKSETCIPMDSYRPSKNAIPFDVRADRWSLSLNTPQWNTQAAFVSSNLLGHAEALVVDGSYMYNTTTSPANTDTLVLNIRGQSPHVNFYGFVVRYFILLKDNYFGDHVHFKTLDEHQKQLALRDDNPEAEAATKPPYKKSHDLDVILGVKVDDPRVMLPTNLYSAGQYVQAELASLSIDLRFTNYYMDMELDVSPMSLSFGSAEEALDSPNTSSSNTELFLDGLRVFGHRLFGLPPSEPTYLCNWDVAVGAVTGGCTAEFLAGLARGGAAFGFQFDDVENALVPYSSLIFHDVTFVRVAVQSVHLWLHVDEAAFLLSTDKIDINYNDWARSHYSKRANINIPNLQLSCVNADDAARQKTRRQHPVETQAYLRTDIHLATIGRKYQFSAARKLQQELVRREDQRTHRTQFLLLRELLDDIALEPVDPPAQSSPMPPEPIVENRDDRASSHDANSTSARRVRRQNSFLSLSSSSAKSVRRPRSPNHPRDRRHQGDQLSNKSTAEDDSRSRLGKRDKSDSTGGHSAFHSPFRQHQEKENLAYSSVAFSSQYFAPRFPLDGVQLDTKEAVLPSIEDKDEDDVFNRTAAALEDIDPEKLSEDHAYSSVLLDFGSGITAFITPDAIRHATSLLSALQPSNPDDLLDSIQVGAMTEIFDFKKKGNIDGEIKDLLVRLPKANVRFLNSSTLDSPDPSQEEQDQYDLLMSSVALVTRTTTDWDGTVKNETKGPRTSLHFRLGSAELSASERLPSLEEPQAAVMFQIDKVMVSVGAKEVTYFDADIGSISGSTASGKVEYLASLIHRTGSLASELGRLLSETSWRPKHRLQLFTYRLLEEGQSINDPSFLIRPSAILRSASEHLRTFDSWKLMMRLRQIWASLPSGVAKKLVQDCWDKSPVVPPDAGQLVVAAFQRWRSWDLDDPSDSVLLKNIFGRRIEPKEADADEYPMMGACRLSEMHFILDPGPKQNKFGLIDLNARVDKKQAGPESGLSQATDGNGMITVLSLGCSDAAVNLNWELCELADDILRLYNRNQAQISQPSTPIKGPSKHKRNPRSAYHVVFDLLRGSVEVESVNLKAKSLSDGLKTSVLVQGGSGGSPRFTSFVLHCQAVTSRLHSHSQLLGMFQLRGPSVLLSHELEETSEASLHTIKSTASSEDMTLAVKQDVIVLMEVLDLLVRDEAAQIRRIIKDLPSSPAANSPVKITERLSRFRVNIAMFLDGYSISVPLVQSLTYNISGVVARAACAANFGKEVIFDFDIKENSHEMQINVSNQPRSISLLQIPPTNGRITSQMHQSEHVLTVLASVEVIKLDASAVYSLLTALSRPQISSAINEVQQQGMVIQQHASDVFGPSEPATSRDPSPPSSTLVYNVHLTLAGLQVFAQTPLKSGPEPVAQVLFSLDRAYLQASNRHETHGPTSKYPELHFNLRHIGLDIRRGRHEATRSCGHLGAGVTVSASSIRGDDGVTDWSFNFRSDCFEVNLSPETISTAVDVLGYLGGKIKYLDTSNELDYLRKLRQSKPRITLNDGREAAEETDILDSVLASVIYRFELRNVRVCWSVADELDDHSSDKEDLMASVKLIEFGTRTKKSARLTIEDLQLQTVPPGQDKNMRSRHSALLPEVIFNIAYVSTPDARRMAFQAVGESLDIRLTSAFIVPAAYLVESISLSMKNAQQASAQWNTLNAPAKEPDDTPTLDRQGSSSTTLFGKRRVESLLIDADFAGAVVHVSSKRSLTDMAPTSKYGRPSLAGKYGQFNADDSGSGAVLRSPGLAWKVEYRDNARDDPSLSGEVKIDASSNILYPSVVPLVMDIISSVKEVVSDTDGTEPPPQPEEPPKAKREKPGDEDNILTSDPSAVLGRMKLNLGLRIRRQEFSLSCQPIARVAATACFENIYFTINTVTSQEQGNFFAISGQFIKPQASVQHVYSRESTGSFEIDTITLSLMNSKHVSGTSGVSAILNVSPMKMSINAKQVQDFLLFREIWYPKELRQSSTAPVANLATETSQGHLVQRYQQVAATAAFPWTATISIAALDVSVDLGQAIGKSVFAITDFWVSSKKTSDWEQDLCLGFRKIGIDCSGRLSGFIALQDFKLRTLIQWPKREEALNETPRVQASLSFHAFRLKAAFDYQAFLVADITSLGFLMYNVRESPDGRGDRLVALCDGEAVQVFGTTSSAAQAVALYQALQKLFQERKENFLTSLKEIEKFMKRKSLSTRAASQSQSARTTPKLPQESTLSKSPISLDTDVVVTLKALNLGVFPSTFSDHQVFKMEALNAYARFAASVENRRVHSILKMTLGQLRIGLAGVRNAEAPKTLNEISVEDVVQRATGSRGGTILKVPKVVAVMETWQAPSSNHIDYVFKSAFEGKVEVGWNYSRISYIRGMWANHSKQLEQVWGRELPLTAVKITGVPQTEAEQKDGERQKITAEVNVPQSKYDYLALEPPVIETPQLRDMGEATPPLEWIGLHRERLPNLTHQIVIVSLLELAGEVEDAYARILGSS